jgi:hypothetical protein
VLKEDFIFKRIYNFLLDEIKKKRRETAVVHLAVEQSVPDTSERAVSVEK